MNNSEIDVDQAALTGESLPVTFYKGDSCKMGSTVVRGEVEATVEFTGIDTFFGKTASLLASTGEVSHLQKVLMSFMMILVFLSVSLCTISFIYLLVEGVPVKEALSHVSSRHSVSNTMLIDHGTLNLTFDDSFIHLFLVDGCSFGGIHPSCH